MQIKASPVESIKDKSDIDQLRQYFLNNSRYGKMYSLLITCGCNLGLRASDLCRLTVGHFRDKTHVEVVEVKTGKKRQIFINSKLRNEVNEYLSKWFYCADNMLLFTSQGKGVCIGAKHIHKVIKRACRELNLVGNYGSHTLRKTFAYHVYLLKPNLRFVRDVLRHSDMYVTKIYVGELNDEKIEDRCVYEGFNCSLCESKDCVQCPVQDSVIAQLNL